MEREEARGVCFLFIHSFICILLTLVLWNHFYSNPRLRRPSHGGIAGRDGWIDDVWMARGMMDFSGAETLI